MGAFAPSLLEWVGSSKAMALRISPSLLPGSLSQVAMRAKVGSQYPSLPLHWAACGLVVLFRFLLNFTGDISVCSEKGINNMKKRARVHVHIFMRGYICRYVL